MSTAYFLTLSALALMLGFGILIFENNNIRRRQEAHCRKLISAYLKIDCKRDQLRIKVSDEEIIDMLLAYLLKGRWPPPPGEYKSTEYQSEEAEAKSEALYAIFTSFRFWLTA
jgi:hypothetical protein